MKSASERTRVLEDGGDGFNKAIEWLLFGLLAFMPFAFGAVEAWSEEIVVALAAAISVCFLLQLAVSRNGFVTWTWAYVPIAAFLLLAFLQMVSLPVALVRFVSPETVSQKLMLLRDLHGTAVTPSSMTMSFYVHGTMRGLRLALAVAAVFIVVFNAVRTPDQITRMLGAIVVIGAALVIVTLAQTTLGNGKIYWSIPSPHGFAVSGPFVNHSHYAQFMNLSIWPRTVHGGPHVGHRGIACFCSLAMRRTISRASAGRSASRVLGSIVRLIACHRYTFSQCL